MNLINVEEAAQMLGLSSKKRLYEVIARNQIPQNACVRIGRRIRINADVLEQWLQSGSQESIRDAQQKIINQTRPNVDISHEIIAIARKAKKLTKEDISKASSAMQANKRKRGSVKERSPGSFLIRVFIGQDINRKRHYYHETFHGTQDQADVRLSEIVRLKDEQRRAIATRKLSKAINMNSENQTIIDSPLQTEGDSSLPDNDNTWEKIKQWFKRV